MGEVGKYVTRSLQKPNSLSTQKADQQTSYETSKYGIYRQSNKSSLNSISWQTNFQLAFEFALHILFYASKTFCVPREM